MIQPVNQPPIQFDEVAASYQNEIQRQLLQSDDIDSPITAAFHEWVRGLQGIKTLEDVNKENLLEYQKIIFLCEHNLIFNLIFHNRFDLLRELLTEFEPTNKKRPNFSHNRKVQIKPAATTTSNTPIITTTQNEELFRYLETLQREQPKLERWLNLYETLKQLEHAYADEQYQIDYDAYQEIDQIVIDFMNDEELDELDHEKFRILHQNRLEERQQMAEEDQKSHPYLEEKQNIGAAFTQIFKSYEQDVFNLITNVNDAIHAQILELNPNEETNQAPKEKLEKQAKKTHAHLQRHSQIQNKHDAKKAKAAAKIENFRAILQAQIREAQKEAKIEQKNNLRKLHESILGKQNEIQNHLNEDQVSAFGQFLHQLEEHYQNIDATDTPQALQAILGDCAEQLGSFMDAIESIPDAEAFTSHLEEVGGYFLNLSHKKVNVAHIPVPDISQIKEKPLPKKPEPPEASSNVPPTPEEPVLTQQKLKAMVSAIREGNTQEKLSPIPEGNQEDAEEVLEEIATLFNKARSKAEPPFAEDNEASHENRNTDSKPSKYI